MSLRVHGDTIARPGMLDFAVNIWPERPAGLDAALARALAGSDRYPDQMPAREAIAARHGRPVQEVLLLNGACEAFWLLAHAVRPALAACVHPAFTEPEAALRAAGTRVVRVLREPRRWSFDPGDVPEDAELVVLGNPNNPTGALDSGDAIAALARPRRVVVVDESFIDFVPGGGGSLAGAGADPGVVVVRSMTKLWSLAGIRAGYLLGPADLVTRLDASRQPWSVNGPACAALAFCAGDTATPERVARRVAAARAELVDGVRSLPDLHVWPSDANFLLVRAPDGAGLVRQLAGRGIAVRPARSFPGLDGRYLRIAVRTREDNRRLLAELTGLRA